MVGLLHQNNQEEFFSEERDFKETNVKPLKRKFWGMVEYLRDANKERIVQKLADVADETQPEPSKEEVANFIVSFQFTSGEDTRAMNLMYPPNHYMCDDTIAHDIMAKITLYGLEWSKIVVKMSSQYPGQREAVQRKLDLLEQFRAPPAPAVTARDGWIGVDLDGTLAHYTTWQGIDFIGAPIEKMVNRVKEWIAIGQEVRIFTARACDPEAAKYIHLWCYQQFGQSLPVTNVKDYHMLELWDDRAVGITHNTGELKPNDETSPLFQAQAITI